MTTTFAPTAAPAEGLTLAIEPLPPRPSSFRRYLRETGLLVGRSLRTIPRVPERLSDVTIQPVIFTMLFLYVFGSAIDVPGLRYQDFLLPGLIGQGLAFGIVGAGVATATDFTSGVIDRFRSLPIHPLSVLSAQVIGQMLEQVLGLSITLGIGLALGWRPDLTPGRFVQLVGLIALCLLAFTWVAVLVGMTMRSADAMQGIGFALVFPLTFLSGAFVPIEGMKTVPRLIGEWDPISAVVAAMRELCTGQGSTGSWPLEHPIVATVGWCALIIAVCVPLALRRFRTVAAG